MIELRFADIESRDTFIETYYPTRKGADHSPGWYNLPDDRVFHGMSVMLETVRLYRR